MKSSKLLTEVYGEVTISYIQVFEWHKRFNKGLEEVDDNEHLGCPSTSKTEKNIEKVNN